MRVLVVNGSPEECAIIAMHLIADGHVFESAADAASAAAHVDRAPPEVMVVDWGLEAMTVHDLVKAMRANESHSYVYTLALMASATPATIAAAFAAGVDDVMRKPLMKEELVARVGALGRIKRWASRVLAPMSSVEPPGARLSKLHAWVDADRQISTDLMEMLGSTVLPAPPEGDTPRVFTSAAEIPLSLPCDGLEVRLMVAFDAVSLAAVGHIVFGGAEVPEGALDDVVREFANTAGGAFKRAAIAEGITLTTGIPAGADASEFGSKTSGLLKEFVASVEGSPIRIGIRLAVTPRALERVRPDKLREGMVIGRDVLGADGAVVVPSGTRLTEATVTRLSNVLRPHTLVEIAAAA